MAFNRRRRRYDPYGPYDPYDDPRYRGGPRGWGPPPPRGYWQRSPAGGWLRDACLLESGCCIAESCDGNCLLLGLLSLPHLLLSSGSLLRPGRTGGGVAGTLVAAIRVYQREVSSRRPSCCRFTPSCSEYGVQAITAHGARRGLWLTAGRLLRCRPGGRRGADPVPPVSPAAAGR